MNNEEICELYDMNPDMTLVELANVTGKTVAELKQILMAQTNTLMRQTILLLHLVQEV